LVLPATDLSTSGQGPAKDGKDVGVDMNALNAAMGFGDKGGTACTFTLDPPSMSYTAAGDSTLIFVVASSPDCAWSASDVPDWMSFNPESGTGSGQTTATVAPNPDVLRRASPMIGGQIFPVSQDSEAIAVQVGGVSFLSSVGVSSTISGR